MTAASAGLGDAFESLKDRFRSGQLAVCDKAVHERGVHVVRDPAAECRELSRGHALPGPVRHRPSAGTPGTRPWPAGHVHGPRSGRPGGRTESDRRSGGRHCLRSAWPRRRNTAEGGRGRVSAKDRDQLEQPASAIGTRPSSKNPTRSWRPFLTPSPTICAHRFGPSMGSLASSCRRLRVPFGHRGQAALLDHPRRTRRRWAGLTRRISWHSHAWDAPK